MFFGRPEVIPIARRQMNVLRVDLFRDDGRDEEILAKEEFVVLSIQGLLIGILKKKRLHQWHARARGFFHGGVNVGEKSVTQLDVALTDRFLLGAARPWLVIGGALGGVVAINGIEHT